MNNAQFLVEKIKNTAKSKNIMLKTMLSDCDLNVNTLNQISDKKGISCFGLKRIADYLDVSVDYLLGRTDNPNTNKSGIITGDVKGINVKGDTSVKINTTVSKETAELMEMLQDLTLVERSRVVIMIDEMKNKHP